MGRALAIDVRQSADLSGQYAAVPKCGKRSARQLNRLCLMTDDNVAVEQTIRVNYH
jgi:hypothetical protein